MSATQPEPAGNGQIVYEEVIKDIRERAEFGKKHYGTYLRTNNGRSALLDAYEEALDLVNYLKQLLMEENNE